MIRYFIVHSLHLLAVFYINLRYEKYQKSLSKNQYLGEKFQLAAAMLTNAFWKSLGGALLS